MKKLKEIVLEMKNEETKTVEQLKAEYFASLEDDFNAQLEKLRREGELWFPKKDVIERIGLD
ncbi:hypothetical protein COY27_06810 [Candidatus Woesearchaeota archaeon CG_4_10_14_0_2_um_filter_33_13]|nr:MAG: hypothetical protein COY27_06810 [Candidatus Woesearchaeota archaeon CG_4_10_14_0_2_um_filter_33_13]